MALDNLPLVDLASRWGWFVPLGLVAWALLLVSLPRTRAGLAVTLLSVISHVVTYAPRLHMHDLDGYAHILHLSGANAPDMTYGEGLRALHAWPMLLLGWPIDGMHWIQSTLSVLAVPQLYALMRRVTDERAAVASACLLALAPLPLALAPTDTSFVPLVTMEILAVHGLVRGGRLGDLMLIFGAGFVTHLRPLEGLFGVAICAVAWAMGRRRAAAGVAAMVALRLVEWWAQPPDAHGLQLDLLTRTWRDVLTHLAGFGGRAEILDPARTPVALTALAIAGVAIGWTRARRFTVGLIALVVLGTLVYVFQPILADRMRYQLPVQPWLAALAGLGFASLSRRRSVTALMVAALAVSTWFARQPYPPFPWQTEYVLLRQALRLVPEGSKVAYDASVDVQESERTWARAFANLELVPLDQATPDVAWRWVGLADHLHGVKPPRASPVLEVTIPPPAGPHDDTNERMWGCDPCEYKPMAIGLYRRGPGETD